MGRDSTTKFIGVDVHSETIFVAIADYKKARKTLEESPGLGVAALNS
jgi:hypothetical protein